MEKRKIQLTRMIARIEHPYPPDDWITSYADFLKARNYIYNYQFNPVVLKCILQLANELWTSSKRVNRLSLLHGAKQCFIAAQELAGKHLYGISPMFKYVFDAETRHLLFELFKKVYEMPEYIRSSQRVEALKNCNYMLISVALTPEQEAWLCQRAHESDMIVNRILRYPVKSAIISEWVKNNFTNSRYIIRRAEMISWMIDQDPNYEIDIQTLIDDFETLNQSDIQAIRDYEDEIEANKIIAEELGDILPKTRHFNPFKMSLYEDRVDLTNPELKLTKRPYPTPKDDSRAYSVEIPNFEKLKETFFARLDTHRKITMIWAIYHCRLDPPTKLSLLKKYYYPETYYTLYKVCKKSENVQMLKWMLDQE